MQDQRSLLAQFLRFSSATVASLMVFSLYSIVDGLFVAKGVGDYAMAAVNLAVPFTNVMFSIAVTFAVGTSTILSIYLGQGNREHANRLFSQNLALLVVIGLTITALVLIFLKPFALLLGAEEETLGYTMSYLRGLAPFAICFIVSYNLEILVKTDGRPMLAILTVCIGCLTNCVLDYVAIFVLNWGAWGAAFATGLSQLLTCVIYITHFLGKHTTFHLVRFRPEGSIYRRLIPSDWRTALRAVQRRDDLPLQPCDPPLHRHRRAGELYHHCLTNTLVVNIMLGVSQGSQPLVSFQYGRKDSEKYRRLLRYGLITVAIMTAVCFAGIFLLAPQLVHIFLGSEKPLLNAASTGALRRYALSYLLVGFNILMSGFLTAVERPRSALCISMGRGLVLQAGALLLLAALWGGSSIWFAPLCSELLCFAMALILMRRFRRDTAA
ncbi:MAG: MATE family efflux transporter [Oscillospiraceae bacterium]